MREGIRMRLTKLKLKNFRCFSSFEIELEKDITVIVAENSRGKSAILDGIALAVTPYLTCFNNARGLNFTERDALQVVEMIKASGQPKIPRVQKKYPVVVEAEGFLGEDKVSWKRTLARQGGRTTGKDAQTLIAYGEKMQKAVHEAHDEHVVLPVIAYYGTGRMWDEEKIAPLSKTELSLERDAGYYQAIKPSSTYQAFALWFRYASMSALEYGAYQKETKTKGINPYKELLTAIKRALKEVIGGLGWTEIEYSVAQQSIVLINKQSGALPIGILSDGLRSVISIVADIAYRMVRLNPDLGSRATAQTPGIVLVDEIDLHLHPSWQQTIVADLRRAFPQVQFILTTHSPQVLTTVSAEAIRALRWESGDVEIYSPEFSLGAESYQLLKEIQNVDARPQALPIVRTLMRYLELINEDEWDSDEALSLRKELDAWGKGREPALLKADMAIKMRAYRRQQK